MDTREYLQQYGKLDMELKILKREKQELRSLMYYTGIRPGERVQQSRNTDRFGTIYAKIEQRELQIARKLEALLELRTKIFNEIDAMPDEQQKYILYQRYILFGKWDDIAEDMGFDKRQAFRLHNKALEAFRKTYLA